jgi:hypothetical protein
LKYCTVNKSMRLDRFKVNQSEFDSSIFQKWSRKGDGRVETAGVNRGRRTRELSSRKKLLLTSVYVGKMRFCALTRS